jgi:predicted transcriptional regulator
MAREKEKEKAVARELFVNTDLTQKDIAEKLEVSPTTVVKWASEGKWDDLKLAKQTTHTETIVILRHMLKSLVEKNKTKLEEDTLTPGDMDMQTKLVSQIDDLENKIGISTIIEVLDGFFSFIPKSEKDFRKTLAEYQTKFLMNKVNG